MIRHRLTVAGAGDGAPAPRLEGFVRQVLPALGRRLIRALAREGAIRVNGRRAPKGVRLAPGDVVTIDAPGALTPQPELPIRVLWEDATLVVVDKPGGLAAHALDPRARDTVASWVVARYPEARAVGDPLAPGLAHRLDGGTSGALVVARTLDAWQALRRAFHAHEVEKHYQALIAGTLATTLRLDTPLAHAPGDRGRMIAARPGLRAWPAVTIVTPVASRGGMTRVAVTMPTGVTHQIRAHLALAGYPIVGDPRYGGPTNRTLPPSRHALHAMAIVLRHPTTGRWLDVHAPWPADLERVWQGS